MLLAALVPVNIGNTTKLYINYYMLNNDHVSLALSQSQSKELIVCMFGWKREFWVRVFSSSCIYNIISIILVQILVRTLLFPVPHQRIQPDPHPGPQCGRSLYPSCPLSRTPEALSLMPTCTALLWAWPGRRVPSLRGGLKKAVAVVVSGQEGDGLLTSLSFNRGRFLASLWTPETLAS